MYSQYSRCACGCELVQIGYPESLGYPGLHRYYCHRHVNSLLSEPDSGHTPRTPIANVVYPRNMHVQAAGGGLDANRPGLEHHDAGRPAEYDPVDALHLRGGGRKPSIRSGNETIRPATGAQRILQRFIPPLIHRSSRIQRIEPTRRRHHPPPQHIAPEHDNTHVVDGQAGSVHSERSPATSTNNGDTGINTGIHESMQERFSSAYNRDHADSTALNDDIPNSDTSRSVFPPTNQTKEADNYNEPLNTFIVFEIPVARPPPSPARRPYFESAPDSQRRDNPSTSNGNQTGENMRQRVIESATQQPFRRLQTTSPASYSDSTEHLSDEAVAHLLERQGRRLQLRGALRNELNLQPNRDITVPEEDEEETRGRPRTRILPDAAREHHRRIEREPDEENRRGHTRHRQGEEHLGSPASSSAHQAVQAIIQDQAKETLRRMIHYLADNDASKGDVAK